MKGPGARLTEPGTRAIAAEVLVWLALSGGAYALTFGFDDPLPVYDFGPAHWPRVVLFCMFAALAWIIYTEILRPGRKQSVSQNKAESSGEDDELLTTKVKLRIVLIFATPIAYTYLMHKIGFILVTPFFLFFYMYLMGVRKLRSLIILTVGIYAGLIIVFVKLIFTYLPPGAGVFNQINGTILGWLT